MRRCIVLILALIALFALTFNADARSRRRARSEPGVAGQFDYYLLSLSWSPEFCAGPTGARDDQQCGASRRFGFVVHGLWPQYEHGFPESCGTASPVPSSIVTAMLPLMPSPKLIQHEWENHGTCSGLKVQPYFEQIEKAFATVKVPADFKAPIKQVEIAPTSVQSKFVAANPSFPPDAFRVQCRARYLSEVRVCLTKDLKGRACSSDVRNTCRDDSIIMRPLR
jgi:ribonuclease T2